MTDLDRLLLDSQKTVTVPNECPDGCVCEEKCLPAALELLEKAEASGAVEILDLMGALSDAMKEKSA